MAATIHDLSFTAEARTNNINDKKCKKNESTRGNAKRYLAMSSRTQSKALRPDGALDARREDGRGKCNGHL